MIPWQPCNEINGSRSITGNKCYGDEIANIIKSLSHDVGCYTVWKNATLKSIVIRISPTWEWNMLLHKIHILTNCKNGSHSPVFQGMHVAQAKVMCGRWTDRQTEGQTDKGQSDPYLELCSAVATKKNTVHLIPQYKSISWLFYSTCILVHYQINSDHCDFVPTCTYSHRSYASYRTVFSSFL